MKGLGVRSLLMFNEGLGYDTILANGTADSLWSWYWQGSSYLRVENDFSPPMPTERRGFYEAQFRVNTAAAWQVLVAACQNIAAYSRCTQAPNTLQSD
jgi:hypothetical protein